MILISFRPPHPSPSLESSLLPTPHPSPKRRMILPSPTLPPFVVPPRRVIRAASIRCGPSISSSPTGTPRRTCKNCKKPFDPSLNHPSACLFHPAHFGGETKRKFESVYSGGTMDTPDSGKVFQYWHCCGSEDPFHPGCTAAPHCSYDD